MKTKSISKRLLAIFMAVLMIGSAFVWTASAAGEEWDAANATAFVFSDEGISVTEGAYTGYKIEGTALTINGEGTYVVSGSCADGSITVKKGTTGVTLVLNGLDLTSADTAPIACNKSTEVTILAAAGSVNNLTDSAYNNDETYTENTNAENAVIKTKDGSKVTLCGTGTINVYAYGKNGVKGGATTEEEGEASLTVKDLTLNVTATVNDGLKSDQELNILSGTVTVSAADDAIKSDLVLNIGTEGTAGPTILVKESVEGIEGATINIYSGNITVHSSDDGINAANSDLTDYSFSCSIYGGTILVDASTGDGIDSNGSLSISGGTVEVFSASSGDNNPLDAETTISITGGTVLAVGAPGMGMSLASGSQAGVSFGSGMGNMGGMGGQMPGDMGSTGFGGGQQPGQGGFGGQMPGQGGFGGQPGGMGGEGSATISAGDAITVTDESGNTLYSATAIRAASYVFFSSPALTEGASYTLNVNGTANATATASAQGSAGGFPGGQQPGQPGEGEQPTPPADGEMPTPPDGEMPGFPGGDEQPTPPADGEMPTPPAQNLPFTDVAADAWYAQAVGFVYGSGLMNGVSADSFAPTATTTRAMVATILYRMAGSPAVENAASFPDVAEDAWYADAAAWAAANGIFQGYEDGSFRPDEAITRAQLVTVLQRYAASLGKDVSASAALSAYTDASAVPAWASEAMSWAVASGILRGDDTAALKPNASATRAELAQILLNAAMLLR